MLFKYSCFQELKQSIESRQNQLKNSQKREYELSEKLQEKTDHCMTLAQRIAVCNCKIFKICYNIYIFCSCYLYICFYLVKEFEIYSLNNIGEMLL